MKRLPHSWHFFLNWMLQIKNDICISIRESRVLLVIIVWNEIKHNYSIFTLPVHSSATVSYLTCCNEYNNRFILSLL
jgi:hypothetical protein